MARDVGLNVDAEEFRKYLRTLDKNVKAGVPGIGKEAAEPVAETARDLIPVRSGAAAKTIRVFGTKRDAGVRAGFKRLPYVGPMHFGHNPRAQGGYMNPVPFLYDALDQRRGEVLGTYERRVREMVESKTQLPAPRLVPDVP